jgi:hypothetical protein
MKLKNILTVTVPNTVMKEENNPRDEERGAREREN